MVTKDIQLALQAHLAQASQATQLQDLAKHLDAFSRDWKKEPTLEQFDASLTLLRESRRSPNADTIALWWMTFIQDIVINNHIDRHSAELGESLLKAAGPLAELIQGPPGAVVKRAIQVCAATYSIIFQICCQESTAHATLWNEYALRIKQLALGHFGSPSEGILLSLCKYFQTVIQTQSDSQPNSVSQESEIKFIDKSIRIQLVALAKLQLQPQQTQVLTEALVGYGIRFSGGALSRSQQQQLLHGDKDNGDESRKSGKRSRTTNNLEADDADMKRLKVEPDQSDANAPPSAPGQGPPPAIPPGFGQTLLGQINITQLPLHHVVDIIFETLAANGVPHLFHSFLSTLPILRLKEGPLPIPPPGVGPPPPGLLLHRPPPPLHPGMMLPPPGGLFPPPPPHLLPPHIAAGMGLLPPPDAAKEVRGDFRPEVRKEANLSKLQLPRIPDDVHVKITVLPPKHTPTELPTRPVVVKSEAVTVAAPAHTEETAEKAVKVEPKVEIMEAQRLLKQETFQVKPFEPSAERPGVVATMLPSRILLEQAFERILDSESLVSVPGASGRKMLEAAASSHRHSEPTSSALVPFEQETAADKPSKVVTKADWMTIVARLLTRAFTRDSQSADHSTSSSSEANSDQGMKERMVDYICSNFKQRRELALTWLHEEWYYDQMRQRQGQDMDDREPQYLWCLYKILDGITSGATQLDARDRGLTRFLLEVPELPDGAVDIIQKYCVDPARAQVGMSCLRDIVNLRPPSRARALEILLSYTAHAEKVQRSMAIVTAKKWYLEHPTVGVKVEEYALAELEMLKDYPVPQREPSDSQQQPALTLSIESAENKMDGLQSTAVPSSLAQGEIVGAKIKTEVEDDTSKGRGLVKVSSVEPSSNASAMSALSLSSAAAAVASTSAASLEVAFAEAEDDIGRHLELYFSLCAKNHGLLEVLFANYISYDPFVQRVIRQKIQPLIKSIKSDSTKLLALIRDFPMGAEMLVLRIIFILTDGVYPSPGLVSAVQQAVVQRDLNARFLIPIISGLDRAQVITNLPRIVSLLKGTERERRTVSEVFLKLLKGTGPISGSGPGHGSGGGGGGSGAPTAPMQQQQQQQRGPVLQPADLLIELHEMEDIVGWKAACEAIDICFNHPEIYKSEIVAVVLQKLLDRPTIPSLFMRTAIQAITLYKNLVGFVNTMILAKMIPKKIWTREVLWRGFVRCAKMMQPTSSSVLASLPKPQLKEVLAMEPSLKEPVEAYLKETKSSGRRVGGGAAKQVNVVSASNNGAAPSNNTANNQTAAIANPAGDEVKKEPIEEVDGSLSAEVKKEPEDVGMDPNGDPA
ncbi:hypothetical protein BGZ98_002041 [Dissophora globulifera]|nr:hypothetical protein BGZ98_002041 [Dissophora globulifera]